MLALALSALAGAAAPDFEQALAEGQLARARFLAADSLREDPTDAARWLALARATEAPREALPLLSEALRLRPGDPAVVLAHARALAALGRVEEAVADLTSLPASPEVLVVLAEVGRAPAAARQALALAPGHPAAALALARLTGDPAEARAALASVTAPDRGVFSARVELALRERDLAQARAGLAELETLAPRGPERERLARWVDCLEREPAAPLGELLDARRRALVDPLHPPEPGALAALAPSCAAAHALAASVAATPQARIDAWTRAVELAPADPGLLLSQGRELLAAGRPAEARAVLERARREDLPPTELALALLALDEREQARALLEEIAPRFPDDPGLALARADAAADREAALAVLIASLERVADPRVLARARALAEALDQSEALAHALRGPRLAPLPDDVSEEVVVVAKRSEERLKEVMAKLQSLGYRGKPVVRGNGDVHFDAEGVDRPAVTLRADGLYEVQRAGLVPVKKYPWLEDSPTEWRVISERKLQPQRERVMTELQPELQAWREALCAEGFEDRLLYEVPGVLDQVWRDGVARDGETLPERAQRRAELLEWWVTRTCTPEGDAVRGLIVAYLGEVVQRSDAPVTGAEIEAINARRPCEQTLEL
jgi:tetratricopeptide (TPR) repeat protein